MHHGGLVLVEDTTSSSSSSTVACCYEVCGRGKERVGVMTEKRNNDGEY